MRTSGELSRSNEDQAVARFITQLEAVSWFAALGKPIQSNVDAEQISNWDDWPGPADRSVCELHSRQQVLFDEIMSASGPYGDSRSELWAAIQGQVVRLASNRVPYDAKKDTWYAPNAAVWHAAWTAGLIGLCLLTRHVVPPELQKQWNWFAEGHWPCAWVGESTSGRMLVY